MSLRIAFITPTLHSLGRTWRRDPQVVKLAAPTIAGYVRSLGYEQLRQYDFEVQVLRLEEREPGRLNLRAFFDDAAVDAYLADQPGLIRDQVDLILETLEVEEADLFALSCASTIGIYADIHAIANINIALAHGVKQRFPGCLTVMGGMQISPDSLQTEEYMQMLRRCRSLDFTAEGKSGLDHMGRILGWMNEGMPTEENPPYLVRVAHGFHLGKSPALEFDVPRQVLVEEQKANRLPQHFVTPETEAPEGDHERKKIDNPTLRVTPWFDPKNIEARKFSGGDLLDLYHLGDEWRVKLAPYKEDRVAVLPYIFIEGCNARCAFCAYSMTTMVKADIDHVIRSLAWMVDTYGVRYFHFLNTNINGSLKYAEAFCDALIESGLDILWSDCANLWALNERLQEKLVRSGCIRLTFGLECPSPRMLKYLHKGIDVETAHQRLKFGHELGLWNHLLLITGLPTETPEDTRQFVEFLERSKEYVHGYSVSSFYLVSSSLMGAFPHRYNIDLLPNASGLLEDAAFNEVGGLPWDQKKQQIVDATQLISATISRIKTDPKYTSGSIDLELLFWLYDRLGHGAKADIVRAYESAFIGAPNHPKYVAGTLRDLVQHPSERLREPLGKVGVPVRADGIRVEGPEVVLPFGGGPGRTELRIRVHPEAPSGGGLATGRRLQVGDVHSSSLAVPLRRVLAPRSPLVQALAKIGWKPSREDGLPVDCTWQLERDGVEIELLFKVAASDGQYFVSSDGLAMWYRVRSGEVPEAEQRKVFGPLRVFGRHVLKALAAEAGEVVEVSPDRLEPLARALVEELEAPYHGFWDTEPDFQGFRHGDRYSRVMEAQ